MNKQKSKEDKLTLREKQLASFLVDVSIYLAKKRSKDENRTNDQSKKS